MHIDMEDSFGQIVLNRPPVMNGNRIEKEKRLLDPASGHRSRVMTRAISSNRLISESSLAVSIHLPNIICAPSG
jgi:hypothetical protein